jgi:hypothetical protein
LLLFFAGSIFLMFAWLGAQPGAGSNGWFNSPTTVVITILVAVVWSLLAVVILLGVSSLSTAAINHAAAATLAGRQPTIRGSFGEAWRRGWMYVGLYILQGLIVWVAPMAVWSFGLVIVGALTAGLGRGASDQTTGTLIGLATLFGFMAVGGFALWMLLCVSLAFPGCVVERIDAGDALKRSFRLSKGTRGRIFVLYLLGAMLGLILSIVVTVIFVIVIALVPKLNSPQNSQAMGIAVVFLIYGSSFAAQALTKPVYVIALMLFYYDQRIRNEGFDIEWMMERAGLVTVGATATIREPEPAPAPSGAYNEIQAAVESANKDQTSVPDQALAAVEATEQTETTEATGITETTQPEIGVQE